MFLRERAKKGRLPRRQADPAGGDPEPCHSRRSRYKADQPGRAIRHTIFRCAMAEHEGHAQPAFAHGYFDINLDMVWDTVETALPRLLAQLPAIRDAAITANDNNNSDG